MTKVINFFAGPGAGKSTTAAGLFYEMKCAGLKVELVTEYAKELAYANLLRDPIHANAWKIFEQQNARLELLRDKVDFIVTDSPLLINCAYAHHSLKTKEELLHFACRVEENFDSWENFNVWVVRDKPYQQFGRAETEAEARDVDRRLQSMFDKRVALWVRGNRRAPRAVLWEIRERGWVVFPDAIGAD